MSTESSNPPTAVEAVPKLVQILVALGPEDRQRAITAAMILIGQPLVNDTHKATVTKSQEEDDIPSDGISPKAISWMKKNGITREQLDHVFSIEEDAIEVIAAKMLGASKRQQTVEAYVICGLGALLRTGEPNFTDKEARAVCSKVGCYDIGNHSNYVNALGNLVGGARDVGWKLSNPGLSKAAEIVKTLTSGTHT
jgi:hypothetical protein